LVAHEHCRNLEALLGRRVGHRRIRLLVYADLNDLAACSMPSLNPARTMSRGAPDSLMAIATAPSGISLTPSPN
jgi:hypothetical protein